MKRALIILLVGIFAFGTAQAQNKGTLQVATDVGFVPFAFTTANGEVVGFAVDLINDLYQRLGYDEVEVMDVNWGSIFAGLYASRYDFILGMVTVTEERAQEMLFSESFLPVDLSFLALSSVGELDGFEGLRGKAIAVNTGSTADVWATDNAAEYDLTVQRYNNVTDAVQAVVSNRAFVALSDSPVIRYAASDNDRLAEVLTIPTGEVFAFAFRPDDFELRAEVEQALECAKLDGTFAAIHREWFNADPDEGLSGASVYVGYGVPNYSGYLLDYHIPNCN